MRVEGVTVWPLFPELHQDYLANTYRRAQHKKNSNK